MKKRTDFIVGMLFAAATVILIVIFMTNDAFFNWAFARHRNILSWYIRPLFIIPMVIFAFKKSYTGIFASIFALFTSMFWFSDHPTSNPKILEFLAYEMDYLKGTWTAPKILISLAVPVFFILLLTAAWKRNWKLVGCYCMSCSSEAHMGVVFGGEAGMAILKPAIAGVIICLAGLGYYYKKNISKADSTKTE